MSHPAPHPGGLRPPKRLRPFARAALIAMACGSFACNLPDQEPGIALEPGRGPSNADIQSSLRQAHASPFRRRGVDVGRWTSRHDAHFRKYSKRYFGPGMDWRWFKAQAIAESGLEQNSIGGGGARGLMQLMPGTLREVAGAWSESPQPRWNIAAGILYDRRLRDALPAAVQREEQLAFMLAAYNAGPGRLRAVLEKCACSTWLLAAPHAPPITRNYIRKVFALMGRAPHAGQPPK